MSFNLYVAAGVLIDGCRDPDTGQQSRSNLDFLVTALQALGSKRAISKSFMTQLKIDLEVAGIRTSLSEPTGNAVSHQRIRPKRCSSADSLAADRRRGTDPAFYLFYEGYHI
jgi:hypothetical protein